MNRPLRWLGGLAAAVLLAACTPAPVTPGFTPVSDAEIVKARKQAGIADCPTSDPAVKARPDGLPDIVLDCLGGDSQVRLSGLRGRPMVINLWAQWCAPCRAESPHLRQFAAAAGKKVMMLGIDYDDPRPELAVEFAGLVGWKYPQLADQERRLGGWLGVTGIPVTLFVDADGKLVHRTVGQLASYEDLVELTRQKLGVRL